MKKPFLLLILCLAFACSKEDKDCQDQITAIDKLYVSILENDGLSAEQRREITATYKKELETPCDF